jgi:UDP-N-acetylmuramoyl-tripeptide--D-alanyl-D-alanine ligase
VTAARLQLTPRAIADAMSGTLVSGGSDLVVTGFSIDSRSLLPGDLFIAIHGDRFDGHRFVEQARSRGACGAVVSEADAAKSAAGPAGDFIVIRVGDTIAALQALARQIRRDSGTRVVAVTGSAGKTTTKEVAAQLLALRYDVFRNRGNLNNHIGLPLSLLELRRGPEVAVVELGMNHAGEIRALVGLAAPEVRVWTNVGEVHTEFFPTLEAIADAKAEILEGATPATLVVANAADPLVMSRVARSRGRVMTFGIEVAADVQATDLADRGLAGTEALIRTSRGAATFTVPLVGRVNLDNVLAATAVAIHFDIPLGDIAGRVRTLTPAPRRGEVFRLRGGLTLVDDSYNSNPRALTQALAVIAAERVAGRRIAVIGEMLELGVQSLAQHRACGRAVAASGISQLIAVGGDAARELADAARQNGVADVTYARSSEEAADLTAHAARPGDLVFVKGSRGIRTDAVADRVKAEFA